MENLIATSSETGYGKDEVLKKLRHVIDVAGEEEYVDEDEIDETEETDEAQA